MSALVALCISLPDSARADDARQETSPCSLTVVCPEASPSAKVKLAQEPPHITFGRAVDLVGRPVSYVRPRQTGKGGEGIASFATEFGPGSMPSRMPVAAYGLTSSFGFRQHPLLGVVRAHSGIDLAASSGSPIFATSDGRVGTADWRGGYGLFVALDHGGGVQTRYGHMSRLNVFPGQQVRKGDVIGFVGSTGLSTGPHLHYEVRVNGEAVNPLPYMQQAIPGTHLAAIAHND